MRLWNLAASAGRWSRLKAELLENGAFRSLEDARIELFDYIDGAARAVLLQWHRPPCANDGTAPAARSSLGYLSPEQYEKQYYLTLNQNLHK